MASVISGDANVSATEFGYLDGVTSALQTQMDAKLATATAASTYLPIAGGKILQIQSTLMNTQFTTTSTGFVDITGLSLTITPSSTSSKVFIIVTLGMGGNTVAGYMSVYNLYRNSTAIALGATGTTMTAGLYDNNSSTGVRSSFSYLDSPNTTSSTIYKVGMRVNGGTGVLNRLALNTSWNDTSTITAMEVSG